MQTSSEKNQKVFLMTCDLCSCYNKLTQNYAQLQQTAYAMKAITFNAITTTGFNLKRFVVASCDPWIIYFMSFLYLMIIQKINRNLNSVPFSPIKAF